VRTVPSDLSPVSPRPASDARLPRPRVSVRGAVLGVAAAGACVALVLFDGSSRLEQWSTVFVAMVVQAVPFLMLGVVISGLIAAFVRPEWVTARLPRRQVLAVPVAGLCGVALPGCECGSVPIAGRLVRHGVPAAPALTFLLAAPAVNPVVLVSTAVAFPGQPGVVVARFAASMLAAVAVGWWWLKASVPIPDAGTPQKRVSRRGRVFVVSTLHDASVAGGFLVVGAAVAATIHAFVPASIVAGVAGNELLAVLTMVTLAVLLSVCSEADAFVAAGLPQFSLSSRLVFLVVGPVMDVKLVAMQHGVFGARFVRRFAPLCLVCSVSAALIVGWVLL
jgi:uncharacterized protein